MASGCSDCSSRALIAPMNIAESLCTWRIGRSPANQRSPGDWSAGRWRDVSCGPATRSTIAAPIRPRTRSAAPRALIYLLSPREGPRHFLPNGPGCVTSDTFPARRCKTVPPRRRPAAEIAVACRPRCRYRHPQGQASGEGGRVRRQGRVVSFPVALITGLRSADRWMGFSRSDHHAVQPGNWLASRCAPGCSVATLTVLSSGSTLPGGRAHVTSDSRCSCLVRTSRGKHGTHICGR